MICLLPLAWALYAPVAAADPADGGLAAPTELRARVVPDRVKLGEPFTLEVQITHDADQRYELRAPGDLGDFEYLGQQRRRVDGPARSTTVLSVKLSAFALGEHDTPALELDVVSPQGQGTLPVPRAKVTVDSSLPPDAQDKGADLYDVRPPEEVPIRSWRLLYALAAALGLAALAWAIRKYLKRPRPVVSAPRPPPEPLHVRAMKALDALAAENLPGRGEFKAYYFRLSEIVRGYLGELYGFEALESTTPELLEALRTRLTPGLPMNELAEFAQASDFIRYAKAQPSLDDCKLHLELAYRIVHATQAAQLPADSPTPSA